ncbi:MAG: hypothetical protein PVF85_05940, partial [Anaerolineales bacterium]
RAFFLMLPFLLGLSACVRAIQPSPSLESNSPNTASHTPIATTSLLTASPHSTLPTIKIPTGSPRPLPTTDPLAVHYLSGVEDVLRHSAAVVSERAIGIAEACPDRYILAFPYKEPYRNAQMTLEITSLVREPDGTIREGQHTPLWNLKGEGVEPETCKQIIIEDRSEPGLIRIAFRVQDPNDSSWRVGVASGKCPGDEVWLRAYFNLEHPENYSLIMTRYDEDQPMDYWLQDGDRLQRYQWEPWEGTLLWTLEDSPGRLVYVEWNADSADVNADGHPDLKIVWNIAGTNAERTYISTGTGFSRWEP